MSFFLRGSQRLVEQLQAHSQEFLSRGGGGVPPGFREGHHLKWPFFALYAMAKKKFQEVGHVLGVPPPGCAPNSWQSMLLSFFLLLLFALHVFRASVICT